MIILEVHWWSKSENLLFKNHIDGTV